MKIDISDDRYSRLELIPWWDQNVLRNAKVMVAGCGALGNEIVKNLALLGIGNIFVADMDNVEESNLTRSVLFRKEDLGIPKAEVISKRTKEINDEVSIKYFNGNIFKIGLGEFKNFDIVIGGLDNREARLFINQTCWKINRPWIDGAIEVLTGVARMFIPPEGVCYECTMSETDYKILNKRKSCMMLGIDEIHEGKIPTTPTIASVIAGIQVQEAVKYLHKRKDMPLLDGKGFVFTGYNNDSYIVTYQKNENCPSHYTYKNFIQSEINFGNAKIKDLTDAGKIYFGNENFFIEFNNEVVYELYDEKAGKSSEFFGNMNLMSVKDIKLDDDNFLKIKSFHNLKANSEIAGKLSDKKLTELNIPFNDIISIRNQYEEIHIEFRNMEIFK